MKNKEDICQLSAGGNFAVGLRKFREDTGEEQEAQLSSKVSLEGGSAESSPVPLADTQDIRQLISSTDENLVSFAASPHLSIGNI